jgi:hypothetical protein
MGGIGTVACPPVLVPPLVTVSDVTKGAGPMALYPCDYGAHRYSGAQQTAYPAVLIGGQSQRRKLRLCPIHFAEYISSFDLVLNAADQPTIAVQCWCCGTDKVDAALFLTYYEQGQERQDLWGSSCEAHLAAASEMLRI